MTGFEQDRIGITQGGSTSPFWAQNPYGFKAGVRTSDAQNNLVKFGLRWYLGGVGSWTQEDTLDNPLDPNNANRYADAGSDPINGTDTSGNYVCGGTLEDGTCMGDSYNARDALPEAQKGCDALGLAGVALGAIPGVDVVALTTVGVICAPFVVKDLFSS